jgi:hypothetical protein
LTNLTSVAASDDFDPPGKVFSLVSFAAEEGTTYWIAVDGANGVRGQVALAWTLMAPSVEVRIAGVMRLPDGRLVLECVGQPGVSYAVDGSTNLEVWTLRMTLPNPDGVFHFTNEPSGPQEFFRLRQSE